MLLIPSALLSQVNYLGVDDCIAESHVADERIDEWNLGTECVNSTGEVIDTSVGHCGNWEPDLNKFWEVEGDAVHLPVQITDVQG